MNNENLVRFFETGEKELFFSAWKPLICESEAALETEVLLNVYFYVYHTQDSEGKVRFFEEFKEFLQNYSEFISKRQELIQYFALPFISNPRSHTGFQHLYTIEWNQELRQKMMSHIKPPSSHPTVLENLFMETIPSPKSGRVLKKISSSPKFSRFFPDMTFKPLSPPQPPNQLFSPKKSISPPHPPNLSLNYTSICSDLSTLSSETSLCALLQALRWKLTQTDSQTSSFFLSSYIKNNLLCTTKPHDTLLDRLLSSSKRVQESCIRLLNVISFKKQGRDYILTKDQIIPTLLRILYNEKSHSALRVNCLSLIQKLSLSKAAQIQMIQHNMIKYLIKVLRKEIPGVDEEMIEFCSGILMNLSVRSVAKEKFEEIHNEVIATIIKYLNYQNERVVRYTFCLLYTLISYRKLRESAKRVGIEKVLKGLKNFEGSQEIEPILEQLSGEADNDTSLTSDIETEDFCVVDDDMEDIINDSRVLKGNELLQSKYETRPNLTEKVIQEVFISRDKIPRTPYN